MALWLLCEQMSIHLETGTEECRRIEGCGVVFAHRWRDLLHGESERRRHKASHEALGHKGNTHKSVAVLCTTLNKWDLKLKTQYGFR